MMKRVTAIMPTFEFDGYDMSGPNAPKTVVSMMIKSRSLIVDKLDLLWQAKLSNDSEICPS